MSKHTGKRYGRLLILSVSYDGKKQHATCVCECGNDTTARLDHIVSGRTMSCGCYLSEASSARATRHAKTKTKEYIAWRNMKSRCINEKDKHYADYGGRGITVCEEWLFSFDAFLADMGEAPSKFHSLERVLVNKSYSKDNCVWATVTEQARNKRNSHMVTAFGQTKNINEWADLTGMPVARIRARLRKLNWTPEKALSTGRYESYGI